MKKKVTEHQPNYRWQDDAVCKGVPINLFFPQRGEPISSLVKELCADCPVRSDCLEYSLHHEKFGVWAGHSEDQRQKIRRERNIIVVTPESYYHTETQKQSQKRAQLESEFRTRKSIYSKPR